MTNTTGIETEIKFLIWEDGKDYSKKALKELYPSVKDLEKRVVMKGDHIDQGYLPIARGLEIARRINMQYDFKPAVARLRDRAGELYFALKGKGKLSRPEREPKISRDIFDDYWELTRGKRVDKIRLDQPYSFYTIEFDVYNDRDLILAEVEVKNKADIKKVVPLGKDVTYIDKYKNSNLAK